MQDLSVIRVLLVEDDGLDADLLREYLATPDRGHDPSPRSALWPAEIALTWVREEAEFIAALAGTHDVVVADYRLAGWNGFDAFRRMRAEGHDLPFILISGRLDDDVASALSAGLDAFLPKKDASHLPAMVRQVVAARRAQDRAGDAERALAEEVQRTGRLLDGVPFPLWELDVRLAWRTLERTPPAEQLDPEILRFAAAQVRIVGRSTSVAALPREGALLRRVLPQLLEALVLGRPSFRETLQTSDDRSHLVHARLPPSAALSGLVLAAIDVTDQHELRGQLLAAQRRGTVGQLVSGMAHDFNNLLMVLSTYGDLIHDQVDEGPVREDVQVIRETVQRAAGLVRHLLGFGRRQATRPQRVALAEVVREAERLLRRVVHQDIRFEVEIEQACDVRADRTLLEQVLMNLVVNARDAMPDGGVLQVCVRSMVLGARGDEPGGEYAVLEVRDSGPGVPAEVSERIFEPFFSTKADGGHGLGLAMVRSIVEEAKGRVELESTPGEGATFRVILPAATEATWEGPTPKSISGTHVGRVSVLVVEPDDILRRALERIVAAIGHRVVVAADLDEACVKIAGRAFDVVVVDGAEVGDECVGRLRQRQHDLAIVLITTSDRPGPKPEDYALLRAPFPSQELADAIVDALLLAEPLSVLDHQA